MVIALQAIDNKISQPARGRRRDGGEERSRNRTYTIPNYILCVPCTAIKDSFNNIHLLLLLLLVYNKYSVNKIEINTQVQWNHIEWDGTTDYYRSLTTWLIWYNLLQPQSFDSNEITYSHNKATPPPHIQPFKVLCADGCQTVSFFAFVYSTQNTTSHWHHYRRNHTLLSDKALEPGVYLIHHHLPSPS